MGQRITYREAMRQALREALQADPRVFLMHSNSFESWYAHVPGLRVLAPATVEDARAMLKPALADPDPVLIFEHTQLYNTEAEL